MGKVFDASEEKYNMNTGRMERRHLIDAPAKLLLNSQRNESKQLKRKIDLLTKDLSTSAKSTQMNNNEVKKRDYFMFILKYISISSLFLILTGLVIKNGNISPGIGHGIMAIVVIVLILIIGLNMFYNKNRNQVYFNKRDWSSMSTSSIKCNKK
jgi:membrane-bound ClpP family serine protease